MAEFSYPFGTGDGAIMDNTRWAKLAKMYTRDGVFGDSGASQFQVVTSASVRTTTVSPGECNILGFHYELTTPLDVTHQPNSSGQFRLDLIALRLDLAQNEAYIPTTAIAGTPGSNTPPSPTRYGTVHEMPIAVVRVESGASTITADKIFERRMFRDAGVSTAGGSDDRPTHFLDRPWGHQRYEKGPRHLIVWDGFGWQPVAQFGPPRQWTPVVRLDGDSTLTNRWSTWGRYRRFAGNLAKVSVTLKYVSNNELPSQPDPRLSISLPFTTADFGATNDQIIEARMRSPLRIGVAEVWPNTTEISRIVVHDPDNGAENVGVNIWKIGTLLNISGVIEIKDGTSV